MAKYRVMADREACQGVGACVQVCPKYFYLSDEDGKTKIKGAKETREGGKNVSDVIEVEDIECFKLAEDSCPMSAIKVERS